MAQDPRKINPTNVPDKTYPGQGTGKFLLPRTIDLLPTIFKTDTNKKLLNAAMEDLFQPHALEDLNYAVGRKTTKTTAKEHLPHPTARRQLETGMVYYRETGAETLSADEVAQGWGFNDRSKEPAVPVSVLDLPIDPDKFVNWPDYHWIEEGLPVVMISAKDGEEINVLNDIIGQTYYTSPTQPNGRKLEFKNGMRIMFRNFRGNTINGEYDVELLSDGKDQIRAGIELNAYDRTKIGLSVDGVIKQIGRDYHIYGNTIFWINSFPAAGQIIHLHLPDYYITTDADMLVANRRWQIDGVGSANGIKLLGRSYQYTNTVYSKSSQLLWDQTAVPWDSSEWDGTIRGINAKHYILMQAGTTNRSAHSRVNVWYHKDAIQTLVNYLGISFTDIAGQESKALRPIVEFEHNLELYKHGTKSRAWPNFAIEAAGIVLSDFLNLPLETSGVILNPKYVALIKKLKTKTNIIVKIIKNEKVQYAVNRAAYSPGDLEDALSNPGKKIIYQIVDNIITWVTNPPTNDSVIEIFYKVKGVSLSKLRILWLQPGEYKNKILNIVSKNSITEKFLIENIDDNDAVVIDVPDETDPFYLKEYYWVNGEAIPAQLRISRTQQPLFELYDADQIKFSDNVNHPQILNSKIVELVEGPTYDNESGYNLTFLPSQFNDLSENNTIRNAMYDIVFRHAQQDPAIYSNSVKTSTIRGVYSFRRQQGTELSNELSHGYLRAWFRLKSWAIHTSEVAADSVIDLHHTAWPTYHWVASIQDSKLVILQPDNYEIVVNNTPVFGRNEVATIEVALPGVDSITLNGSGIVPMEIDVVDGIAEFVVPDNAPAAVTIVIGGNVISGRVINTVNDPRSPQIKLNGLPVNYSYNFTRNEIGYVTELSVAINGTGNAEIKHQGLDSLNDHITAIPGLDYNTEQNINLGQFTPSRLIGAMYSNISSNKLTLEQSWIDCPRTVAFNGALMADHSSLRSAWASFKMSPSIQTVAMSRANTCWRWHRGFLAKLDYLYNLINLETIPIRESLDRILEELLIGVNYSSPDSISGMALTTSAMNIADYVADGIQTSFLINTGSVRLYFDGPDHVYVYVNGHLILRTNYTIDIDTTSIIFNTAPGNNDTIVIYHSIEAAVYSGIPSSLAKLGISGLFEPKFVTETWSTNSKTFIQRHDGSRITIFGNGSDDVRNHIILELEKRIYNGCLNTVGRPNRQRLIYNFKDKPVSETQAKSMISWFAEHNIDYRENTDYDAANPWTWNYNGKSWRGVYLLLFGTYQLHEAPWEVLGYDSEPTWWSNHYSWTDTEKRNALEHAIKHGIINEPGQPVTIDLTVRRLFNVFPVAVDGSLQDPLTWGMEPPVPSTAQQPWEIGSLGPAELVWSRNPAGAWAGMLYAVDDYAVFNEYLDATVNPFTKSPANNSTKQEGFVSIAANDFYQRRPSIGIGAAIFETYRELNLEGESPLRELIGVSPRIQFSIGGFTDGNISLKMYYNKYQSGSYLPQEDFFVNLTNGVKEDILRYSAVRVEKEDTGFRVYGFDPGERYFRIFAPTSRSMTSNFPSSRRTISTQSGEFIEYLEWNDSSIVNVPYSSYFENKQALFTFFQGLQQYQQAAGLILDSFNERGTITDWKQAALDAFIWIDEHWGESHHCVVGVATTDGLKIFHPQGILERLDADIGRSGKILFDNGRSALPGELLITRDYEHNIDKVMPLNGNQIVYAEFATRDYDHVVYINPVTKFGDTIVDFQVGNRLETLIVNTRRTPLWNGRPHARGVIVQKTNLLPGFDALISDIKDSHKVELTGFDSFKNLIGKSDTVPAKATVINELIQDRDTAHSFRQGLQTASGTNLAVNALFRNSEIDIPGRNQDVSINEEWLFDSGKFGNLKDAKLWELEIRRSEITSPKQIIRLSNSYVDIIGDNIIDINTKDPRWITQPVDPFNFSKINRATDSQVSDTTNWLPSAGVANLFDTNLQLRDINSLSIETIRKIESDGIDTISIGNLFKTFGFSRYKDYQPGDYAWQAGILYKALTRITGSSTSAFDEDNWGEIALTGANLPSIWVSDYGFNINARFKGSWTANILYKEGDIVEYQSQYYTCGIENNLETFSSDVVVDSIIINDGGIGYAIGDIFSLSENSNTSGHGLVTAIGEDGKITSVEIVSVGSGYTSKPVVVINSAEGTGATLSCVATKFWIIKISGYGWNILQTFAPSFVEEACPNALNTGLNESRVTFANPHGLLESESFILSGSNDGNYDRVHKVKKVVDDYNVLIGIRSTSDRPLYNMVAFKLLPVKFDNLDGFNDSKLSYDWRPGMKAYIDKEGEGEDYNYNFEIIEVTGSHGAVQYMPVPSSTTLLNNFGIVKAELVDYDTEEVIARLEVFDPYKGLTIDSVAKYIDYRLPVDPASYNIDELGNLDEYVAQPWGNNSLNKIWWDLSKVRYIEYEQGSLEYRYENWGKQFADSEVVIYEWTKSKELPSFELPGIRLDFSSGVGQVRYSVVQEINEFGAVNDVYYYWKRGSTTLPLNSTRLSSAASIENILNNPDNNKVAWIAMVESNLLSGSFVVANINDFMFGRDKAVLRIEQNTKPEQKHNTGVLLAEGKTGSIIPEDLFLRLHDSLVGQDQRRTIEVIKTFQPGNNYAPGQLISLYDLPVVDFTATSNYGGLDIPVLPSITSKRENISRVWINNPLDPNFGIFTVQRQIVNPQSWDSIVSKIKRIPIAIINEILEDERYYGVVERPRSVPDISLHPKRRFGNAVSPKPQSWFSNLVNARRNFITAINDYLLNVDVISKENWDRYLRNYTSLLGSSMIPIDPETNKGTGKFFLWDYVDYNTSDSLPNNYIKLLSINDLDLYPESTSFSIIDDRGVVQQAYNRNTLTGEITLTYRRNGTIQFAPIWQAEGWDTKVWDTNHWDFNHDDLFGIILKSLREHIFVGEHVGYLNLTFFNMVKESLVQNPTADWVTKTTYLGVEQTTSNDLNPVALFYNKKDALLRDYINEVKPYHSKIIDDGTLSKSLQTVGVLLDESLIMNITDDSGTISRTIGEEG